MSRRTFVLTALAAGAALNTGLLDTAQAAGAPAFRMQRLQFNGFVINLRVPEGLREPTRALALLWVRRSADAVHGYFNRFPVDPLDLRLVLLDGGVVRGGFTSVEEDAPFVRVGVGKQTSHAQFFSDWILVHEMVHLAVPRILRKHNWLHEGLATYVEGVARTRAGIVSAAVFWGELASAMPRGLPQEGDQGLDHTHTWGRTYWGGAMFCLLADVRIRTLSNNQLGLQHALQGVLAAGGSYAVEWPVERLLQTADLATGHTVLMDLYAQAKDTPMPVDLPALWAELGVSPMPSTGKDAAPLNDAAPLAQVRRAIAS
ncbi:MAG: hypothetical protein V4858_03925 [Pseudomonadota bacterium]